MMPDTETKEHIIWCKEEDIICYEEDNFFNVVNQAQPRSRAI